MDFSLAADFEKTLSHSLTVDYTDITNEENHIARDLYLPTRPGHGGP
jgi:hypothetical protein